MATSSRTSRPPLARLAAQAIWLLVTAVAAVLCVFSLRQLYTQSPWVACPSPTAVCPPSTITPADVALAAAWGVSPGLFTLLYFIISFGARLVLALAGLAIFVLRPRDWLAWLMSLVIMTVLLEGAMLTGAPQRLADLIFLIGTVGWMPLPFIFPNGRVEPRWLKWPVVGLTVVLGPVWAPIAQPFLPPLVTGVVNLLSILWSGLGLYSMIYRYRRVSTPTERQQIKWVLVGFAGVFAIGLEYFYLPGLFPPWRPSPGRLLALLVHGLIYLGGYGLMAVTLLFAMLRYRLWAVDVVIRRTLLYSLLTALLAGIYFGAVVILQTLFSGLSGNSSVAIIGSTLLIATLFQPLRRRLQAAIDRRFYRRKYDAAQALAGFAASARDDVDLNGLTTGLLAVVDDTMQPTTSGVWLRQAIEAEPVPAVR